MLSVAHLRTIFTLCCLATVASFLMLYSHIDYHLPSRTPLEEFALSSNTTRQQKYIVATANCRIPRVSPYSDEVMKFYRRPEPINCMSALGGAPLVKRIYDKTLAKYRLHIEMHVASMYVKQGSGKKDHVYCCYMEILRPVYGDRPEADIEVLACREFKQDFIVPQHLNAIYVECRSWKQGNVVYRDAFYFIQKMGQRNVTHPKVVNPAYGVLLVGIENLSQINLRRSMPQTFARLKRFHEFSGYSKIAHGAYPNLMAVLTGLSPQKARHVCNTSQPGDLNRCPFIWNMASQLYMPTAYAEDSASMQTFNQGKVGFQRPPTDYYLRPFMQAIETRLPIRRTPESPLPYCIGEKQAAEYVLEFALEFANRFKLRGGFGVFWLRSFSQPHHAMPARMDTYVANWLHLLYTEGLYEHYVVVLFSDSGAAEQPINDVPSGYYEERLPALFVRLPRSFERLYEWRASRPPTNRRRLVSPYDLHVTLEQLLVLARGDFLRLPSACPKAFSLLETMPDLRRCHEAGIAKYWCSCRPWKNLPRGSVLAERLALWLIKYVNGELRQRQLGDKCAFLRLQTIHHICLYAPPPRVLNHRVQRYLMRFTVNPGKALFHFDFDYDAKERTIIVHQPKIRRLDKDWPANAACATNETFVRRLCVCRETLNAAATTKVDWHLTLILTCCSKLWSLWIAPKNI